MSHQSYGPDVGVPRILDMLDELGVPATFFVPGLGRRAAAGPRGVDRRARTRSGAPLLQSPVAGDDDAGEERADFERALAVFDGQGIEIRGHRAALWGASWQTPSLVAEHGLPYDSSLMGDDRPYRIDHRLGPIVELPVHWSLDDWEQYAYLPDPHIGSVIESPGRSPRCGGPSSTACAATGACSTCVCTRSFRAARPDRGAPRPDRVRAGARRRARSRGVATSAARCTQTSAHPCRGR